MKKFETGKEKIQKICDMLRRETLEPAETEAEKVISDAKAEAERIIEAAKAEAAKHEAASRERIAKERSVFQSSMEQGCRQAVESLRQSVEKRLFDEPLAKAVVDATADPELVAKLVNTLVSAVQKEGIEADLAAIIPQTVKKDEVVALLLEEVKGILTEGLFAGGAKVQLKDQNITIDVSDEALIELLGRYIRKDYREILFG